MKLYFAIGLMFSSLVTGADIGLGHDMSAPECVATCSRGLLRYRITSHYDTPTRAVCMDMAKQRELFLCLASSCGDDYGPALAYTISACSNHGALIADLLPVELQHGALLPRRFSHLAHGLDTGRFAFGKRLTLSIDCAAGSNGVLTLSLPQSSAVSDSPLVPGSGAGDPNLGSSPPAGSTDPNLDSSPPTGNTDPNLDSSSPVGNTDPNLGSQPGLPSTSNGGQSGTFAHAASNNPGDNDGPSNGVSNSAATDTDCSPETEDSHNNPSGAPNNGQAQHPSGSSPNGDSSSPNAQTPCPETRMMMPGLVPVAHPLAPTKEHRSIQTMALALILVPRAQVLIPWAMPEAHPLVTVKKHLVNHPLSLSPNLPLCQRPRTQAHRLLLGALECLVKQILKAEPARTARMALLLNLVLVLQGTHLLNRLPEAKATQWTAPLAPTTQLAVIRAKAHLERHMSHLQIPRTQEDVLSELVVRLTVVPHQVFQLLRLLQLPRHHKNQHQHPVLLFLYQAKATNLQQHQHRLQFPTPALGCHQAQETQEAPQPAHLQPMEVVKLVPDLTQVAVAIPPKTPPGPQQPSSPSGSPSSSVPPTQGQTNTSPNGNSLPCDGSTSLCPDNPSTPENEPVPYGQESSPINQVPSSPDGGDGVPSCSGNCPTSPSGSEPLDPGTANSPAQSPGSHNGQSPNDPQAPGDDAASRQPSSPVAGPNQPTKTFIRADPPSETFIRADRPTTTEFVKANRPQENPSAPNTGHGPQVITVLAPTKVEITQTRIITV
ncbi:hypothetical protein CEP52_008746 [Fusarium oligoseptatum]|uniref:Extracellular membrane protein CFEM domain-containing protein n=1 Tax=Fusarium oligoseptatum TaxID=2604345 RepID=A0A428TGE1_9HYPO|nr:hypothetical protein CEP52_008746 [Fusarium oligoseptatum]